jgi:hypothetical protein
MQQVQRAAMAPSDPSSQDQAVAAQAAQIEAQARAELAAESVGGGQAPDASKSGENASSHPGKYLDIAV